MITPDELAAYVETLRAAGITGRAKIGDIEITIPPPDVERDTDAPKRTPRSAKADYDKMLFAATEGIPEEA